MDQAVCTDSNKEWYRSHRYIDLEVKVTQITEVPQVPNIIIWYLTVYMLLQFGTVCCSNSVTLPLFPVIASTQTEHIVPVH